MNPRSKHSLKNLFIHLRSSVGMESAVAWLRAIYQENQSFVQPPPQLRDSPLKCWIMPFLLLLPPPWNDSPTHKIILRSSAPHLFLSIRTTDPMSFQHTMKLEKSPPEVPGGCLIWAHHQSNTDSNTKAHSKANPNTNPYTSIKPWELAIFSSVHIFWIVAASNFPIQLIVINFCFGDLQMTRSNWNNKKK